MKGLIAKILQLDCFAEAPPILLDIGASGGLPVLWRSLAPFSICVEFDADTRAFQVTESENSGWKKLYSFNRLVAPDSFAGVDFYWTKSPNCSSSLLPDHAALKPWAFHSLFDLEKIVSLPAVDLNNALQEVGLDRVDWFKCDSQGTDLRIFRSLPAEIIDKVLVADFEPGIIDAYVGEDKLHQLMAFMDDRPFWVSDMVIKGSQRLDGEVLQRLNYFQRRSPSTFLKTSPGWSEISYLNTCESPDLPLRDCLLAWVFASIKGQHGFAIHLASLGQERFGNPLFSELISFSRGQLHRGYGKLALKAIKRLLGINRR